MPRYDRYSSSLVALLKAVQASAAATPRREMTPALLLEAFLRGSSPLLRELLETNGLELCLPPAPPAVTQLDVAGVTLSRDLRRILEQAEVAAPGTVTEWHVLTAIWPESQDLLAKLVRRRDGQPIATPMVLPAAELALPTESAGASVAADLPPLRGPLGEYGRELSAGSAAHPIVGRDRETNELIAILLKYYKPNAVLLGDAGVGKTAIVEGLASRIRSGDVPAALRGKRIVELPVSAMMAGTIYHGQFEERVRSLIGQAESDPSVILFIDEIHMLVGAGATNHNKSDATDILKPALARGKIRVIGATTWAEYYESIETDPAMKRRFHEIRVEEPGETTVAAILAGVMPPILAHHRLEAGAEILPLVISLSRSELPSRRFPDKAIDVIDRACANAALAGAKRLEAGHVRGVIASLAGIAFTSDSPEFANVLSSLEARLSKQVLRQDEAVTRVARVVRLCKQRLDLRTHRPDGVFLFVGDSGVGKTALANALAETLHGSDKAVIRLDMTGYSHPSSIGSLLGSGPGYVNSDEEPEWLEQLRKMPSAVLLLDELEKAHPEVTKVFLRAFDEGKIADAHGREHSLANVIVIATTNAHVDLEGGRFGFNAPAENDRHAWIEGLKAHFAPEFLNRFDEIVPFEPLTAGDLGIILREKIAPQAAQKLLEEFNLRLKITDAGVLKLAQLADSKSFGARELERVFRNEVLLPAIEAAQVARQAGVRPDRNVVVDRDTNDRLTVVLQAATP